MPPPLYAARCGRAPDHTRLTPGLRRPARRASSSCGRHEYSRCTRQTSDVRHQTVSVLNAPAYGAGHNNRYNRNYCCVLRVVMRACLTMHAKPKIGRRPSAVVNSEKWGESSPVGSRKWVRVFASRVNR